MAKKAKTKKNEVAKVDEEKALTTPLQRGVETDVDREDLIIPRAKLLQALSPEIAEEEIEGLKPGLIINSLTKDVLTETFMPIMVLPPNWIRFNPRDKNDPDFVDGVEPGGVVWRSADKSDPKVIEEGKWKDDKPPLATKFLNFFCIFDESSIPVIISFCNTSFKAGKELLSLITLFQGDVWTKKYKLRAIKDTNDMGTFYVLKVIPAGPSSPEELPTGEALWQKFHDKTRDIKAHDEGGDATTGSEEAPF